MAAFQGGMIDCDYQIMGAPFARMQVEVSADGVPQDFVTVIVYGKSHRESFVLESLAAGEMLHGWISKESPDNVLEMIVYREVQKEGQSKLVNHRVPFGKEMWGSCRSY